MGVIKISFSVIFNKEMHALRGFPHDFSTKKASASGALPPDPTKGLCPWTSEVPSPPLTIYPGVTPAVHPNTLCFHLHKSECYWFFCFVFVFFFFTSVQFSIFYQKLSMSIFKQHCYSTHLNLNILGAKTTRISIKPFFLLINHASPI